MYRLKTIELTPPKGFTWTDPKTGMEMNTRNWANLLSQAQDHRMGNRLEPVDEGEIQDQICANMAAKVCLDFCEQCDPGLIVHGVGWHLHAIMSAMGIRACWGCMNLAKRMDQWGPDGCEAHMEEIVEIIEENASQRAWPKFVPFREMGVRALVRLAITRARGSV